MRFYVFICSADPAIHCLTCSHFRFYFQVRLDYGIKWYLEQAEHEQITRGSVTLFKRRNIEGKKQQISI